MALTAAKRTRAPSAYRQLTPYLRRSSRHVVFVAVASLIGGLAEAAILLLVIQAALQLSGDLSPSLQLGPVDIGAISAGSALIGASALVAVRLLLQLASVYVAGRVNASMQRELRSRLIAAFLSATSTSQAAAREGELPQLLGAEAYTAASAVTTGCSLIAAAATLAMLIASTFTVDPLAAAIVLASLCVLAIAVRPFGGRLRRAAGRRTFADLDLSAEFVETVRVSDELRAFGVERARQASLDALASSVESAQSRVYLLSNSLTHVYQTITVGLLVVGLAGVNTFAPTRAINLGAVVLLLLRSFAYAQQAQYYAHLIEQSAPSLELLERRENEMLAERHPPRTTHISEIRSVAIRDLSFSYGGIARALDGVTFSFARGEIVGIVGASGAGKSTLAQLLVRLRTPVDGDVLVNEVSSSKIADDDWTRLVAYVPQEPKLITASVAENIRFFRDGNFSVESAARAANIHDEILEWDKGYETVIGHRGSTVSGGQRQRICLARALWGSPQLIVLDEATSALDAQSEQSIQQTLANMRGKATVIIIAHRPSTLEICDRILVFEKGTLVSSGTLREMMNDPDGFVALSFGPNRYRGSADRE